MVNLYRKSSTFKVLHITLDNLKEIELNDIIVYDNKGIIVQVGRGYFDNGKSIEIGGTIKRKIKKDFSKKENFVIKSENSYSMNTRYDLYIYKDNVDLQFLGFKNETGFVMAEYSLNGGEFSELYKNLCEKKYELKEEFKRTYDEIKYYDLPYEKEKLQKMLDKMVEINNKTLEIEKRINDFDVETMVKEKEEILKRLEEK